MQKLIDISIPSLIYTVLLTLLPFTIIGYYNKKLLKNGIISVFRMIAQLFFATIYLVFLFKYNNPFINISWYLVMIISATYSILNNTQIKFKTFLIPVSLSITLVNFLLLLFFNTVIVFNHNIFDVKYFIVISGMLLGNSLKAIVIGINSFYSSIKENIPTYQFLLGNGASFSQATKPFFKDAITKSASPIIASMSAVGLVHLPGMMTGQLLGGVNPTTAVKYQIVIMLVIFASITLSLFFSLIFSLKIAFNKNGVLDMSIYKIDKRV